MAEQHRSGEARFRRLALALPGAKESSHGGAADFRLGNRIFATLAYVARGQGTLKLTPDQQSSILADLPGLVEAAPEGWGRMGMTLIRLDAPEAVLQGALRAAHHNLDTKQAAHRHVSGARGGAIRQRKSGAKRP